MNNNIKHNVNSCAINKISQFGLFKIDSKIQFLLKMIPQHLFYQIYVRSRAK